ncbi:MAG TPA: M23 family metallopeptidase [Terriglobia bacterium]|nr:M23 family metallopeptidase [Terriglobia bacterium]
MRKRFHFCAGQRFRRHRSDAGIGGGGIFLAVVLLIIIILIGWKAVQNEGPTLSLASRPRGLGQSTQLAIEARDSGHNVRRINLEVSQNGHALYQAGTVSDSSPVRWWKWSKAQSVVDWTAALNRRLIPGLKEGSATLRITAVNDSWGRFFRGGESRISLTLPVRFTAPQIGVITTQHYINQGGCDMVVFNVSPGTVESGVQVGKYFFTSFPVKPSMPQTRLAIFAYPWDLDPSTPAEIVARDDARNQAVANFSYRVFPKKFHTDTIALDDAYVARVVPPIMSETPELDDLGSPLKNFLAVNGRLRQIDSEKLIELSKQTSPTFLWHEPFIRLASKTEAYFADARTYTYKGEVVDHQTHLGFDLAGVEHMPVLAANDGVVAMAQYFGIFGNAVLIDHGMGVQTLYGHMSQLEVKPGEAVKRGQEIGRSGATGLAGGDHLHFTVLLDGIPVNPTEWWDPHWIHDRIEAKLEAYR